MCNFSATQMMTNTLGPNAIAFTYITYTINNMCTSFIIGVWCVTPIPLENSLKILSLKPPYDPNSGCVWRLTGSPFGRLTCLPPPLAACTREVDQTVLCVLYPQSFVKVNRDISAQIWYTLKHTPQMLGVLHYSGTVDQTPIKRKRKVQSGLTLSPEEVWSRETGLFCEEEKKKKKKKKLAGPPSPSAL